MMYNDISREDNQSPPGFFITQNQTSRKEGHRWQTAKTEQIFRQRLQTGLMIRIDPQIRVVIELCRKMVIKQTVKRKTGE